MNVNEVIANRAIELAGGDRFDAKKSIHPNDHVNMGQSTNDMFPTTIHVAVAVAIRRSAHSRPCTSAARRSTAKAKEWEKVLKIGRTHLIDATPLSLGQEIGGMARQLDRSVGPCGMAIEAILELPVGGTAVGSGINTHPQFARRVCESAKETGIAVHRGGRSLRGQRPARRAGRVPRRDPHHRRHALHRRQQHPLAQLRPADRLP